MRRGEEEEAGEKGNGRLGKKGREGVCWGLWKADLIQDLTTYKTPFSVCSVAPKSL